jgi:hypothetical protein
MGDGFDRDDLALLAELATPVADGGCSFCGVTLQEYAIGNVTHQWPRGSHLRWLPAFDDLGAVRSEQVRTAFTAALKEISDCCDVTHEMVSAEHKANLVITIHRLDGKSGVLGDCGIPMGNADPDRMQLRMRLDTSERWGLSENPVGDLIDLYRVFLHEAEHFHGLGHKPTSIRDPALIAPMYSPSIRNLQPADKGELLRRYGQPKAAPPPVKPPPPTGVVLSGGFRITDHGPNASCQVDASKPGYVLTFSTTSPKTWAPAPTSGLHVAGHPVQALPIEQPEEFDVPEKWRSDPDDPTDIMDEGDLT